MDEDQVGPLADQLWDELRSGRTVRPDVLAGCDRHVFDAMRARVRPEDLDRLKRLVTEGSASEQMLGYSLLQRFDLTSLMPFIRSGGRPP